MGVSTLRRYLNIRISVEFSNDLNLRVCIFPIFRVNNRPMAAITINADWIIYHHFIPLLETMDQCKIAFLYFSILELLV